LLLVLAEGGDVLEVWMSLYRCLVDVDVDVDDDYDYDVKRQSRCPMSYVVPKGEFRKIR
jgi:uncharacterized radical SAM superfamily Fe-S cluster-containing enzyme